MKVTVTFDLMRKSGKPMPKTLITEDIESELPLSLWADDSMYSIDNIHTEFSSHAPLI